MSSKILNLKKSIAVLFDTFIVRTFAVTAITGLLGDWNWWPSKPPTTKQRHASSPLAIDDESLKTAPLDEALLGVNDVDVVVDDDEDEHYFD